ncbi:sensor histidine kinase [Aestuariimicrobium ganziense]|uniref:sensor histidine kinase n=1 Tax=Aestuariimicrobium ganziense TaxID=2773677 RepID=UPI001942B790|nr:sensor histidine kinase [Aestuariimicrobium ganziense]
MSRFSSSIDPDRMAQVVTNLVGNAIRATDPGGSITVLCRPDGRGTLLSVTDTGVGLDADEFEKVFERFHRAEGSRRGDGSGVGLTIARGIVEAHGGTITASSEGRGLGSTFTVRLPAPNRGLSTPR